MVILDRNPKSMIGCPSGRRAVQSFMMVSQEVSNPGTNSLKTQAKLKGSIFSCYSDVADIQVLKVDAGYKIRYDEVFDTGRHEFSKIRKM